MALTTAQSVLFAELFGEADALLRRFERFAPEIHAAHEGLAGSAADLVTAIERYRTTIQALTEQAQRSAVTHIIQRTNEVCEGSLAAHTEAMKAAARTAFDGEAGDRVLRLAVTLERALGASRKTRLQVWLAHVATATVAASAAALLVVHLLRP